MLMHFRILFFILSLVLLFNTIYAQKNTDANIFGHVISNNEHIPGISIYLKGTTVGAATDRTGHYFLYNLPLGMHTLVASGIGFKTKEVEIQIVANTTLEIDFILEESILLAQEVVVTASRFEQKRQEAPVIVSSISSKLLNATNALSLADGLSFQPGMRVENNCQNCGFQQVRINGLEGPYSQILIDGRPVFSSLTGVYGLEQIPTTMIDRIEVIKGGGSATYGSNAIAGTINVITKDPLYNSFQLSHNISAFNDKNFDNNTAFNATILNNGGASGVTIFGNNRSRQAIDITHDGFSDIPLLKASSLGFKAFYRTSNTSKLTLEYHNIVDFRRGGDNLKLPPHQTMLTEQIDHNISSGNILFEKILKDNMSKLNFFSSIRNTDRLSYYGADYNTDAYGISKDLVSFSGIEYVKVISRKKSYLPQTFLSGIDFNVNDLSDKLFAYGRNLDQKTQNLGLFMQGDWKVGKLTALAGVRLDKHNMVDEAVLNPRLNIMYSFKDNLQIRGGFATGFRAPQAFDEDLHMSAAGGEIHFLEIDPDLDIETSLSYNVSLDYYPKFANYTFNILLDGFYTHLNNTFVTEPLGVDANNNMVFLKTNAEGAFVYGINTEINYRPSSILTSQFGFTIQKSQYSESVEWSEDIDATPTLRMFRTPDNYGFATFIYQSRKINLNTSLTGIYTGSMLVPHYAGYIAKDKLVETPDFFDLNFKTAKSYKLPQNIKLELALGVKNILNSFQKDLDKGFLRDAAYIYGPVFPRHFFFSVVINNL